MSQLSSRGFRYAPVKKILIMWAMMPAMNRSAAQWWICRHEQPAAHVKADVQRRGIGFAHPHAIEPRIGAVIDHGSHAGLEDGVRNTPVSSRMMNEYQDDLRPAGRPVVREHLPQQGARALGGVQPVVEEGSGLLKHLFDRAFAAVPAGASLVSSPLPEASGRASEL